MLELVKKNWMNWMAAFVVAIIGTIFTNHWQFRQNSRAELNAKIDSKAELDYVKEQNKQIRFEMETRDNSVIALIEQHRKESILSTNLMLEYLKSIDARVNNQKK